MPQAAGKRKQVRAPRRGCAAAKPARPQILASPSL